MHDCISLVSDYDNHHKLSQGSVCLTMPTLIMLYEWRPLLIQILHVPWGPIILDSNADRTEIHVTGHRVRATAPSIKKQQPCIHYATL